MKKTFNINIKELMKLINNNIANLRKGMIKNNIELRGFKYYNHLIYYKRINHSYNYIYLN